MKNGEYWKTRFNDIEQKAHDQGAACFQGIEGSYTRAIWQLTEQILSWYQRFADNNEISLAEARKWLSGKDLEEFRWTVQEYIQYGQENAVDGQWTKQLENASSRYHISRLEALRTQLRQQIEVLHGGTLESLTKTLKSVYSDSYYRTAFEVQKGVGVGWSFGKLDQRLIDKVINNPWSQSGDRFSDAVWKNKTKLLNELETELTQGIILGKDPQKVIDAMSKKLNTSKSVTGRLVMTESAFFSQQAQHDAFGELDVEKYEIVATLDNRTSEICQDMDGKVFKMSEWEVGVTAPPFHPWCRTTAVPHFDDEFDVGERAARDEDGNVYYVPAGMTYKDWKEKYVTQPQKMRYNTFKDDVLEELKSYSTSMHAGNQSKHMRGAQNFDPTRSELIADPQMLHDKYSGNGEFLSTSGGSWNNKERFTHTENIGIYRNGRTGKEVPTNTGIIHYSKKKGWHIVPARPQKGAKNDR